MTISLMRKKRWGKWRNTMESKKDLDSQLLKSMFNSIRSEEIKNIKTQKRDDKAMVRVIEEFVNKKVGEEMKQNED